MKPQKDYVRTLKLTQPVRVAAKKRKEKRRLEGGLPRFKQPASSGPGNSKFRVALRHMANVAQREGSWGQRARQALEEYKAGLINEDDFMAVTRQLDDEIYGRADGLG